MNEKSDWDHNVEGGADGPVVGVSQEEVLLALNENSKSPWTFRSITRVDCCKLEIQVMAEICLSPRWIWNAS